MKADRERHRANYRRLRKATEQARTAPVPSEAPVLYDPVGVRQIAERLGVSVRTVSTWGTRGIFPQPAWRPSVRSSVWEWQAVVQWAADTGRAPGQRRPADPEHCPLCGADVVSLVVHEPTCPALA